MTNHTYTDEEIDALIAEGETLGHYFEEDLISIIRQLRERVRELEAQRESDALLIAAMRQSIDRLVDERDSKPEAVTLDSEEQSK